jgi:hypothetical protein
MVNAPGAVPSTSGTPGTARNAVASSSATSIDAGPAATKSTSGSRAPAMSNATCVAVRPVGRSGAQPRISWASSQAGSDRQSRRQKLHSRRRSNDSSVLAENAKSSTAQIVSQLSRMASTVMLSCV